VRRLTGALTTQFLPEESVPETISQQPASRIVLAALGILILVHAARIGRGRAFPGAWNDVGGILMCLAVAYPSLPPARSWLLRGHRAAFVAGFVALLVASFYCTFVLGE
jgi:hypothetical protein